ncbi:MAG: hypothetical protein ACXVWF_10480, partial [Actinomycetota bacterium]
GASGATEDGTDPGVGPSSGRGAMAVLPGWSSPPLDDFGLAAEAVLAHLASVLPLTAWTLARLDGADAVVLAALGGDADLSAGATFPWAD